MIQRHPAPKDWKVGDVLVSQHGGTGPIVRVHDQYLTIGLDDVYQAIEISHPPRGENKQVRSFMPWTAFKKVGALESTR